jgi:hypothetical protein
MIQLSNDEFISLYKLASIGKLVGGLIHNLNGPMQNLGLDIEMARYSLKDESKLDSNMAQGIIARLKRMEEEHERINLLIRTTSAKTGEYSEKDNNILNAYEYLRQEILFFHTNLYFKHNVETEIISDNGSLSIGNLTQDSLMALGWFMQALIEELESQKLKGLTIKIIAGDSSESILFQTHGGRLSEKFMAQFQNAATLPDSSDADNRDLGILITMVVFQANGITLKFSSDSDSSVAVNFPISSAELV